MFGKGTSMMKVLCTRAMSCESGATATEYALTAMLISAVLLMGANTFGSVLHDQYSLLSGKLDIAAGGRDVTGPGSSVVRAGGAAEPGNRD